MPERREHEEQRTHDMDAIHAAITDENNLSAEILLWAFYHVQEHPTCTIEEAVQVGFDEWVK